MPPPNDQPPNEDPIVREVIASGMLLLATIGLLLLGFVGQAALLH
jgi:hypothetical protein